MVVPFMSAEGAGDFFFLTDWMRGVRCGVNTLGALAGVLASTFWLLEHWGFRARVGASAGVNLMIGAVACLAARNDAGWPVGGRIGETGHRFERRVCYWVPLA